MGGNSFPYLGPTASLKHHTNAHLIAQFAFRVQRQGCGLSLQRSPCRNETSGQGASRMISHAVQRSLCKGLALTSLFFPLPKFLLSLPQNASPELEAGFQPIQALLIRTPPNATRVTLRQNSVGLVQRDATLGLRSVWV